MAAGDLVTFLGGALIYALLATLLCLGIARLLWPAMPPGRIAPPLLAVLFFVFLTQHPFPDPAALDCPLRSAMPRLTPLGPHDVPRVMRRLLAGPAAWLADQGFSAAAMNFLLCALIGALLVRTGLRIFTVAAFGAVLTLTVEFTQLTGIWGIYPCAYRKFDVNDLILNFAGTLCGALLWAWLAGRRGGARGKAQTRP